MLYRVTYKYADAEIYSSVVCRVSDTDGPCELVGSYVAQLVDGIVVGVRETSEAEIKPSESVIDVPMYCIDRTGSDRLSDGIVDVDYNIYVVTKTTTGGGVDLGTLAVAEYGAIFQRISWEGLICHCQITSPDGEWEITWHDTDSGRDDLIIASEILREYRGYGIGTVYNGHLDWIDWDGLGIDGDCINDPRWEDVMWTATLADTFCPQIALIEYSKLYHKIHKRPLPAWDGRAARLDHLADRW